MYRPSKVLSLIHIYVTAGLLGRGGLPLLLTTDVSACLLGRDGLPLLLTTDVTAGLLGRGGLPVSYTHLDVYKRQDYRRYCRAIRP